jgi:hypothetical protein
MAHEEFGELWLVREEFRYRLRYFVNAYPALYMPLARVRHREPAPTFPIVTRDTELVIEGFGRAGSTFAQFAFQSAQERSVKIAHHTHAAAQVITAVKWGIPTIVIVRDPVSAALSHMVRHQVSAEAGLRAWARFHRRILPYRGALVVTSFEAMTRDFGDVIRRVNEKFGTKFGVWTHSRENEAQIFEQIRVRNLRLGAEATPERLRDLALPTPERESLKKELRRELERPELDELRESARALYRKVIEAPA